MQPPRLLGSVDRAIMRLRGQMASSTLDRGRCGPFPNRKWSRPALACLLGCHGGRLEISAGGERLAMRPSAVPRSGLANSTSPSTSKGFIPRIRSGLLCIPCAPRCQLLPLMEHRCMRTSFSKRDRPARLNRIEEAWQWEKLVDAKEIL